MEHQAGLNGQDLSNYYTWMLERTLETMQHQGTWVVIIDLEGWNLGVCVVCVCACACVCVCVCVRYVCACAFRVCARARVCVCARALKGKGCENRRECVYWLAWSATHP